MIGHQIGPYTIVAKLGAGGMGEVYRARDSKLKRDVAIKVLPADVANDSERLARFQREAEVLASLNHPHIAHVYGFENPPEGGHHLVMELVEGEDLAERIARGPIHIDEALPIARQIAEALEAAHDAGIIHRDLKPANVKVRSDGTVKVLDFGLAKALETAGSGTRDPGSGKDPAHSPTITSPAMTHLRQGYGGQATQPGMILGTAAYMSPEQAKGKPVDKRADIWAFGCVLYEMLSGKRAFQGDDVTDIITSVMRDTPDFNALPADTPATIRTLLRRCIEKDPRKRAPHMAIARMEIDDAMTSTGELVHRLTETRSRVNPQTVAAVAIVAGSIALIGGWALGRSSAPEPAPAAAIRFQFDGPLAADFSQRVTAFLAVAPDGQRVAYIGQPRGRPSHVWVHSFKDGSAREFENAAGATTLFWSPDSKYIAFQTPGQLNRLDVTSGTVQPITATGGGGNGSWGSDGTILFAGGGTISRVPSGGGQPESVTTIDTAKRDVRHSRPVFLPDGRHFLFTAINAEVGKSTLHLGEVGSTTTRILDEIASGADYVNPGYLVFARDGKLMARPFDATTGQWTGEPLLIADAIRQQAAGAAAFSASIGGVIAYDSNLFEALDLEWVTRNGHPAGTVGQLAGGHTMALAVDDTSVAVETSGSAPGNNAVWVLDAARGTRTRLTFEKGAQGHPVWSPEGRRLVYFDRPSASMTRLFIKVANATRDAEPLLPNDQTPATLQATDWSRDGRYIVYEEQTRDRGYDLKYVDLNGDRKPVVAVSTPFNERLGQLSADGRLIAYEANETGEPQVYVATFPDASMRWTISQRGGAKPRWSSNGRELIFVDLDGTLQSVAINVSGGFRAGVPAPLFPLNGVDTDGYNYAISRDATRFLVMRPSQKGPPPRVNVIMNWPATVVGSR